MNRGPFGIRTAADASELQSALGTVSVEYSLGHAVGTYFGNGRNMVMHGSGSLQADFAEDSVDLDLSMNNMLDGSHFVDVNVNDLQIHDDGLLHFGDVTASTANLDYATSTEIPDTNLTGEGFNAVGHFYGPNAAECRA